MHACLSVTNILIFAELLSTIYTTIIPKSFEVVLNNMLAFSGFCKLEVICCS